MRLFRCGIDRYHTKRYGIAVMPTGRLHFYIEVYWGWWHRRYGLNLRLEYGMKIGTKTLLFGNHQFILHPVMVLIAWIRLYHKPPNLLEFVCIIIHDWGYWGEDNLDGESGENHPAFAADLMYYFTGNIYYWSLCMFHSRFQARRYNSKPSKLCLADKYGVALLPTWLWVLMGRWTDEIKEYRADPKYEIYQPSPEARESDYAWFKEYKAICAKWVEAGDSTIGRFGASNE